MKKNIIPILFLLVLSAAPWACKPYPILPTGPFPVPTFPTTPTPTATAVTTPVCVFAPVTVILPLVPPVLPWSGPSSVTSKTYVIRSMADWQAYYGSATPPAPPVNFANQMLLVIITPNICGVVNITSACSDGTQITVEFFEATLCNALIPGDETRAVAVPQSTLPVVWDIHYGLAPGT